MSDRFAWTTRVPTEAERPGIPSCYRDFATDFGAFDRAAGTWPEPMKAALVG